MINNTPYCLLPDGFLYSYIGNGTVDQGQHNVLLIGLGIAALGATPVQLLPGGRVLVTVRAYALLGPDNEVTAFAQDGQVANGTGFSVPGEGDGLFTDSAFDIIMIGRQFYVDTVVFHVDIEYFDIEYFNAIEAK